MAAEHILVNDLIGQGNQIRSMQTDHVPITQTQTPCQSSPIACSCVYVVPTNGHCLQRWPASWFQLIALIDRCPVNPAPSMQMLSVAQPMRCATGNLLQVSRSNDFVLSISFLSTEPQLRQLGASVAGCRAQCPPPNAAGWWPARLPQARPCHCLWAVGDGVLQTVLQLGQRVEGFCGSSIKQLLAPESAYAGAWLPMVSVLQGNQLH
jgi:hypothetical protein